VHLDGTGPVGAADVTCVHDEAWFESLMTAHAKAVHRYFARRSDWCDVDDLTADVLATAWRRRDDVPDEAPLAWLYRTAGFVLANHRRKGRPVPVAELPEAADLDDPAWHAVRDDELRQALAAVGPRDRQVLLLNAWEGLVGEGLAAALGVSRTAADSALSRARSRLRAAWPT